MSAFSPATDRTARCARRETPSRAPEGLRGGPGTEGSCAWKSYPRTDGGVHQNLTFPVQPDPVSGMHCWHQRVTVEPARKDDEYGDVEVDTRKSMAIYREWLAKTRPAPGPGGLRRPLHFARAVKPSAEAYRMPS